MPETRLDIENKCELILNDAYARREAGATTYGPLSFLDKSTLRDAEEELLDLINYSLFAIIKLRRLKEKFPDL